MDVVCHEPKPAGANTGVIAWAATPYAESSTGVSPKLPSPRTGTDCSSQTAHTVSTMIPAAVCRKPFSRSQVTEAVSRRVGSW